MARTASGPNVAAIHLGRSSPIASCNQPGRRAGEALSRAFARSAPSLFGFAPGGACRAVRVAASAVRSYRTLSPLPLAWRSALCGAFPGVAPAGRYPAPSLHGARTFLSRARRERPPGRLTAAMWGSAAPCVKLKTGEPAERITIEARLCGTRTQDASWSTAQFRIQDALGRRRSPQRSRSRISA